MKRVRQLVEVFYPRDAKYPPALGDWILLNRATCEVVAVDRRAKTVSLKKKDGRTLSGVRWSTLGAYVSMTAWPGRVTPDGWHTAGES